jgi:hypothetical protein
MRKIKKFDSFINEEYSFKKTISSIKNWVLNFFDSLKKGLIKKIPDGPKRGLPMVYYFEYNGPGSILSALEDFYAGSDFSVNEAKEEKKKQTPITDFKSEEELYKRLSVEDMDLNRSSSELESEVKRTIRSNRRGTTDDQIFIYGAPGIGKTEIIAQAAEELECGLMVVDLQFMQPVDLLGVPSVVELGRETDENPYGEGATRSNLPSWLPLDNGKNGMGGILFFDELNRATSVMQEALLTLLGPNHNIGDYKLPSKWSIIAAGNRQKDEKIGSGSTITEIDPAIRSRLTIVNYVPDVSGLIKYVTRSNTPIYRGIRKSEEYSNPNIPRRKETAKDVVLPELMQFLCVEKGWLHTLDPLGTEIKASTPRSWIDASKELYSTLRVREADGKPYILDEMPEEESIRLIITSFEQGVGQRAGKRFAEFYHELREVDDKDILSIYNEGSNSKIRTPKATTTEETQDLELLVSCMVFRAKKLFGDRLTPDQLKNGLDWISRSKSSITIRSYINMMKWYYDIEKKDDLYRALVDSGYYTPEDGDDE